jgi:NO-binding membrane sensor protein with MHYT domain
MLHVHNFSYGLLTPALAYLMSFLGAFLGLRCTTRARASTGRSRTRWLLVAGVSIGITGIWVMHFIAMLGFTIPGETIHYNVPITLASMLTAVAFVSFGLLFVGRGSDSLRSLLLSGVITGFGVAAMHYTGMLAMAMPAGVSYDPLKFVLSIVIAIVAATAALWAALRLRGVGSTLGAAAIMGVAVSGMHYTGMAAMRTWPPTGGQMVMSGASGEAFLLPLIVGVSIITFVLIATIALSPTEEEISAEADLMRRIDSARGQPAQVPHAEIGRGARRDQNAGLTGTMVGWTSGQARTVAGCC